MLFESRAGFADGGIAVDFSVSQPLHHKVNGLTSEGPLLQGSLGGGTILKGTLPLLAIK